VKVVGCSCKESKKDKTMGKGVVFFICKLPPEDMKIRQFSMEIVGLEPSFPMIPGLSINQ
jgi:hypothetical protein